MKHNLLALALTLSMSTVAWAGDYRSTPGLNLDQDLNIHASQSQSAHINVSPEFNVGAAAGAKSYSNSDSSSVSSGGAGGSTGPVSLTNTTTVPENQTIRHTGTQTIKNVPSISAPALTSSNDTCAVSDSGSIAIAGLGLGGGHTSTDANCVMLKNAREMWNMGMKSAALALMCTDSNNRYALEITDYECPDKRKENSWISQLFGAGKYKE